MNWTISILTSKFYCILSLAKPTEKWKNHPMTVANVVYVLAYWFTPTIWIPLFKNLNNPIDWLIITMVTSHAIRVDEVESLECINCWKPPDVSVIGWSNRHAFDQFLLLNSAHIMLVKSEPLSKLRCTKIHNDRCMHSKTAKTTLTCNKNLFIRQYLQAFYSFTLDSFLIPTS